MVCNILCFLRPILEFLISSSHILTTTLWRRGQAKSWWPWGERWAHSAYACDQWFGSVSRSWDVFYTWRVSFTCFRKPRSCNGFCRMLMRTTGSVSQLHVTRWCSWYVGFTLRNVDTGTKRNRLHNALQNHHYAPTSVTQWLQIYHSVLLNITTVRYWTCWRSPGSESPLSKPKPWRTFTLLPLKTVITGSCLILARLLEPRHTFLGGKTLYAFYLTADFQLGTVFLVSSQKQRQTCYE